MISIKYPGVLFRGIETETQVGLYHSWKINLGVDSLFLETAHSENKVLMSMEHQSLPLYGVQFHPEADLKELVVFFNEDSTKQLILNEFGIEKWERIMNHLDETSPIHYTYTHFIPNFLDKALVS
jgi:para-aminobenzoate synthetase component 2